MDIARQPALAGVRRSDYLLPASDSDGDAEYRHSYTRKPSPTGIRAATICRLQLRRHEMDVSVISVRPCRVHAPGRRSNTLPSRGSVPGRLLYNWP